MSRTKGVSRNYDTERVVRSTRQKYLGIFKSIVGSWNNELSWINGGWTGPVRKPPGNAGYVNPDDPWCDEFIDYIDTRYGGRVELRQFLKDMNWE